MEEIVIPAEYKSVGANAIVFNPEFEESAIKTITIHRRDGLYPCTLGDNAFANMPNVNVINISDFNVDDYQHFQTK
ncbi:MAG: hypothetical protein MJ195_02780 [Mycoplasmoidaceae bacterium]|nr:hypothetical protein [Mycoplasmoidaceae bacterium]